MYLYALQCFEHREKLQHDLADASFAILKCVESKQPDPAIYNLYGLILESQGVTSMAIDAFRKAIELLLSEPSKDAELIRVYENKARSLCNLKKFKESIETYGNVMQCGHGDAFTYSGYGIALYFDGRLVDSLMAFEKALALCEVNSESALVANDVTVMLSQVLISLGTKEHVDLAKQQLLLCFSRDNKYIRAIVTLFAMGISRQDWTLAQTAALELIKLEPEHFVEFNTEIDALMSQLHLAHREIKLSRRILVKAIRRCPSESKSWTKLASFLNNQEPSHSRVAFVGQCALLLSKKQERINSTYVGYTNRIAGFAKIMNKSSKSLFAKAIRANPSNSINWISIGNFLGSSAHVNPDLLIATTMKGIAECACILSQSNGDIENVAWSSLMKADALFLIGEAEPSQSSVDSAVLLIDQITTNSTNPSIKQVGYTMLGQALRSKGDLISALQAFKTAISFGESWSTQWNELAKLYYSANFIHAAEACWKFIIGIPSSPRHLEAYLNLTRSLVSCKSFDVAQEYVNECLKIDNTNLAARFFQTLVMIKKKTSAAKIQKNMQLMVGLPSDVLSWLEIQQ